MKVEAKFEYPEHNKRIRDFAISTPLWTAAFSHDEGRFPNCDLILCVRTSTGVTFLKSGCAREDKNVLDYKAIEANVKIVNENNN